MLIKFNGRLTARYENQYRNRDQIFRKDSIAVELFYCCGTIDL